MSGAPVIVGTAAVGLVRFALMQDGHGVAGTLYACAAKDITALDPSLSLRPALAPVIVLNADHATALVPLIAAAFDAKPEDLRCAIRYSLGEEAERSVPATKDLADFVARLLPVLVQQGPGPIGVLLRGLVTARPEANDLRNLAQAISPYALEPLDDSVAKQEKHDQALVKTIVDALYDLAAIRPVEPLKEIVTGYRPAFDEARKRIDLLTRYKELHNCLHGLQKLFKDIDEDVKRLKRGDIQAYYVKERAKELRELADTARENVAGLPTENLEIVWINELEACATDMRVNTMQGAPPAERAKVLGVPGRLDRVLLAPHASRINGELVAAAQHVRLDNLAEIMRSAEQKFGSDLPGKLLTSLRAGSLDVGRLRSRLAGLVAEHNEWQGLNTEIELAKAKSLHQPPAKFRDWKSFRGQLGGLCHAFPNEEWSKNLAAMLDKWPPDQIPEEIDLQDVNDQLDGEFREFYGEFVGRFIDVDDELNRLCGKVTSFTQPLDALLRA